MGTSHIFFYLKNEWMSSFLIQGHYLQKNIIHKRNMKYKKQKHDNNKMSFLQWYCIVVWVPKYKTTFQWSPH